MSKEPPGESSRDHSSSMRPTSGCRRRTRNSGSSSHPRAHSRAAGGCRRRHTCTARWQRRAPRRCRPGRAATLHVRFRARCDRVDGCGIRRPGEFRSTTGPAPAAQGGGGISLPPRPSARGSEPARKPSAFAPDQVRMAERVVFGERRTRRFPAAMRKAGSGTPASRPSAAAGPHRTEHDPSRCGDRIRGMGAADERLRDRVQVDLRWLVAAHRAGDADEPVVVVHETGINVWNGRHPGRTGWGGAPRG